MEAMALHLVDFREDRPIPKDNDTHCCDYNGHDNLIKIPRKGFKNWANSLDKELSHVFLNWGHFLLLLVNDFVRE